MSASTAVLILECWTEFIRKMSAFIVFICEDSAIEYLLHRI